MLILHNFSRPGVVDCLPVVTAALKPRLKCDGLGRDLYIICFRGGVVINVLDISFDLTQAWLVSGFSAKKDFLKQNVIVPNGMNKDHTSVEPPFQIFPKFFLLRTKILGNLCHCVVSKSQNM